MEVLIMCELCLKQRLISNVVVKEDSVQQVVVQEMQL